MDQSDQPTEVEIKPGFSPLEVAGRIIFSIVPGTMTYAFFNDFVSEKIAVRVSIVVMIITIFWPKVIALLHHVPPIVRKTTGDILIVAGLAFPFVYLYPSQTFHVTLKIAWAIFRTKA